MYGPEKWAHLIEDLLSLVPRAPGENEDMRLKRIGRVAGVSRATLYNILKGQPTKLIPLDGWLRVLDMIPERHAAARAEHVQNILQGLGLRLEKSGHTGGNGI